MQVKLSKENIQYIKKARKDKSISCNTMSEKLGKPKKWFLQFERGEFDTINSEILKVMAKELDIDEWLFMRYEPSIVNYNSINYSHNNKPDEKLSYEASRLLEENIELKAENEKSKKQLKQIMDILQS